MSRLINNFKVMLVEQSKTERMALLFPFLFLPFILFDFLFRQIPVENDRMLVFFIQNIIFFNTLHILFTFYHLLRYSRFRRALAASIQHRWLRFWAVSLAIFILVGFSFLISKGHFSELGFLQSANLLFPLLGILAVHHGVWQIRGISLAYGSLTDKKSFLREKFIFAAILCSLLFLNISFFLNFLIPKFVSILLATISSVLIIALLILVYRKNELKKFVFLLRLILFPFVYFVPAVAFFVPCIHGIEYILYFQKIRTPQIKRSEEPLSFYKIFILVILSVLLIAPFLSLLSGSETKASFSLHMIFALNFSFSFFHYYLDEKIFKFSNPIVKDEILSFNKA